MNSVGQNSIPAVVGQSGSRVLVRLLRCKSIEVLFLLGLDGIDIRQPCCLRVLLSHSIYSIDRQYTVDAGIAFTPVVKVVGLQQGRTPRSARICVGGREMEVNVSGLLNGLIAWCDVMSRMGLCMGGRPGRKNGGWDERIQHLRVGQATEGLLAC